MNIARSEQTALYYHNKETGVIVYITSIPMFDPLRNDPRFQKLAAAPAPK